MLKKIKDVGLGALLGILFSIPALLFAADSAHLWINTQKPSIVAEDGYPFVIGVEDTDNIIFVTDDTQRWTLEGADGDLVPASDDSVDIGSATKEIADIYVDGTVTTDALVNSGASTLTGTITTDGDLDLNTSGKTIIFEDGTAASTCIGTGTLTAATPLVISTTCIQTGDYVFTQRTSNDADTTGDMWVDTIVDATSFAVTSETSDTATFNWVILKGQ